MGSLVGFESLNDSKEFALVYKEANKWYNDACIIFYKPSEDKKVAFIASKKVGKAVIRNRYKRILKSAFVNLSSDMYSGTYVIIAKSNLDKISFFEIIKKMRWSFKKLGCLR